MKMYDRTSVKTAQPLNEQMLGIQRTQALEGFLKKGADINYQDELGNSLLHIWVIRVLQRQMKILALHGLLQPEYGVKIDAVSDEGQTPMHYITSYYNGTRRIPMIAHECLGILINHGANYRCLDNHGKTPLDYLNDEDREIVTQKITQREKQIMDATIPASKENKQAAGHKLTI